MGLIHKATSKRNVAQWHIRLKHVLGSQFDATPDHKGVRGVAECAPEGAREVRFAARHQGAQIRDKHATGDIPVDTVENLPCLPCQQTLFSVVRGSFQRLWINLPSQQRGCLEYRAVRQLFPMKMTNGRIQQCYYIEHPAARSALTDLRTGLRFPDLSLHCRGTVSAPEKEVDRELQWRKTPSIEGLPTAIVGRSAYPKGAAIAGDNEGLAASRLRRILCGMRAVHAFHAAFHRSHTRGVLAIAALLWCSCAAALNPSLTIKQMLHTAWGPREGAPLGGVQALAQTSDGFLWLLSNSGLYRFDGIAFEHIELPQDAKLASTDLLAVFAPRAGGLWVSVYTGGVAFLRDGRWQVYGAQNGLPPSGVIEFAEMPDGTLWVATSVGFGRFDGVHWRSVGADMGLPAGIVPVFVFVDGQGTVWLGASGKMFTLRADERQFSRFPYSGPMPALSRLAESSAGALWYDTDDALFKIHQNPSAGVPSSPLAHGPAFDHDGTLWDIGHALVRINPERLRDGVVIPFKADDVPDRYLHTDGLTAGALSTLMIDREGNIWVGTAQGLDRFSNPSLEAPLRDERNRNTLGSVAGIGLAPADGAGGLWVTDTYGAVQRYQDGRLATPALKERISCLLRTDDGTVWFGGRNILWRERQGRFESIAPPGPDGDTQALAVDKSGGLWASIARSGVFYLKDSVWTPYGGIATLPRRWAVTIVRDRRDRLWFSYLDGTVAVLDGDQVRSYGAAEGLQIGFVAANYSGRTDQWLGGELGLTRFDGERFHSVLTVPELSLTRITGIVETAAGDLCLNGQSVVVHLPAAELQLSRLDPSYRVNGENFDAFDGLVGNGWMRRPLPTAIEAGNGKLWFATGSAFFGIDPNRLVRNRIPPPVVIRALTVGDHRIDQRPGVTLPVRTTSVRFDYAGLSLTEAQKVRCRYRLDGNDTDWREVTPSRQALYSNLRPGHYTFRVIAANNDGVWNDRGRHLASPSRQRSCKPAGSSPCASQAVRSRSGLWCGCEYTRLRSAYAAASSSVWKTA